MVVMNGHGPRNLLCRRKAASHELGWPAQRDPVSMHTQAIARTVHTHLHYTEMYNPRVKAPQRIHSQQNCQASSSCDDLPVFSETSSETEKHFKDS